MKPSDYDSFCEVVLGFAELKSKQLSAPALELYWRSMQHWDLCDFRIAAEQLLRTCEFMPVPKDFEDLRKAGRTTTSEAWVMVLEHIKRDYRSGKGLDNGQIDAAVQGLGGYKALAFHDIEYLHHMERRFADRYEEQIDVTDTRAAVSQLTRQPTNGLTHVG